MPTQDQGGGHSSNSGSPQLGGPELVHHPSGGSIRTLHSFGGQQPLPSSSGTRRQAEVLPSSNLPLLAEKIQSLNLPRPIAKHYYNSWRPKTRQTYAVYHKKWKVFCCLQGRSYLSTDLTLGLSFLSDLFKKGFTYSSLNVARGALSAIMDKIEGFSFGAHPTTIRVLKGMFNARPTKSRYSHMWDPDIVLSHLREQFPHRELTLKMLTFKLTTLLSLVSCQRVQTLASIKVQDIHKNGNGYYCLNSELLKHSQVGKALGLLHIDRFSDDNRICLAFCLRHYLKRTKHLRKSDKHGKPVGRLILSYKGPYQPVGSQTIARYIRQTLAMSGINTQIFTAHSTRGASTSKLATLNVPIQDILTRASWTSDSTFRKFYQKPIINDQGANRLLQAFARKNYYFT